MKTKLLLLLSVLLTITKGFSQAPQAIPYQAVARDAAGTVLTNRTLGVRFKIHDTTATGIVVYSESQTIVTNSVGTFTANIGQGTVLSGSFANINWVAPKFIQVEMDLAGGTAFVDMGTKQMLSVPYALNSADWVEVDYPASLYYPNGYKTLKAASKYSGFATSNSTASGFASTAMGYQSTASGFASTAMGYQSTASGLYSTAMASGTTASGEFSTAMGFYSQASGDYSTAMGYNTTASGVSSTAMGRYTTAYGDYSTAMGHQSTASGTYSTAMGRSFASGFNSTAMGYSTTASGDYSTAMGKNVSTNGYAGSFMIGDSDPDNTGVTTEGVRDQFVARFNNGYFLLTSNNTNRMGLQMGHNGNGWSVISDSTRKENMVPINEEDFLKKISSFRPCTWNYKGQDANIYRHYGPMAQDFYKAFGHDAIGTIGCDTLINQSDFLGVSFSAIHALEKRTQKIEKLQAELDAMKTENNALREEIKSIKEMLKSKNQ